MKRHSHTMNPMDKRCSGCGMSAMQMEMLAAGPSRYDPEAKFVAEILVDRALRSRRK